MNEIIINKIINLQEIIKNAIRSNQLYKTMGFLEINDLNSCVVYAESIYAKLKSLLSTNVSADENQLINSLQAIIGEISTLISLKFFEIGFNTRFSMYGWLYLIKSNDDDPRLTTVPLKLLR